MNHHIEAIAAREGKTSEEIKQAIQDAINAAWASDNLHHRQAQQKLTGSLTAPTPDQLITAIIREAQKRLS